MSDLVCANSVIATPPPLSAWLYLLCLSLHLIVATVHTVSCQILVQKCVLLYNRFILMYEKSCSWVRHRIITMCAGAFPFMHKIIDAVHVLLSD